MKEYFSGEIRLGWLINPEENQVEVYRHDQEVEVLQSQGMISGEEVLLEFSLNLG